MTVCLYINIFDLQCVHHYTVYSDNKPVKYFAILFFENNIFCRKHHGTQQVIVFKQKVFGNNKIIFISSLNKVEFSYANYI